MTRSRLLTVWAALCLLGALLLWGVTLLDLSFAGHSWNDSGPCPYAPADRVRYGLGGFSFFCGGQRMPGAHPSYPLVVAALVLNTLLLWLARGRGEQARRMGRVSLWALLLTLGLGWPVLKGVERVQNDFLAGGEVVALDTRPALFSARRCEVRPENGPCTQVGRLTLPNPVAWGLLGLGLTGAAGLRRGRP